MHDGRRLFFLHCVSSFNFIQFAAFKCYWVSLLHYDSPNGQIRGIRMNFDVLLEVGKHQDWFFCYRSLETFECSLALLLHTHGLFFFNSLVSGAALVE